MERTVAESLVELDQKHVWHPFTQKLTARIPIPIVKAEGVYLYDQNGNRYLDGISSWWVNLHGHGHPYIANKIHKQAEILEHVIFADFTHPPAVELATRLVEVLPGNMSKIFYSDNGSTAIEAALKMALQYWHNENPETKRKRIVCFRHGYHGDTFGAMSAAGRNQVNRPFWSHLFDVDMIDPPFIDSIYKSKKQLQTILERDETACFIFEPLVLGFLGGMRMYPAEELDALLKMCQEHEVLTIADEVMTGFGRTGTLFACNQLKYEPDIICLSKGLTGGFLPLGVTACKEFIHEAFLSKDLHKAFLHGHSYAGNPLACASAIASLDLLQNEECKSQIAMISNSHIQFCKKWNGHKGLNRCECIGAILALEYKTEGYSYFSNCRDYLYNYFMDRGILLRPLGNVLYVMPPYCITEDELIEIYKHIETSLEILT